MSRLKELGNFNKHPGKLEIKSKYTACHSKWNFDGCVKNCKKSALKHFT